MLPHLRALPEAAISPVGDGTGAAPGSLMCPNLAGSRTTSNSSGFWPHSQGVSKTRTEKALITRVAFMTAQSLRCVRSQVFQPAPHEKYSGRLVGVMSPQPPVA